MAMAETPLAQFINKVKTDENLRKKSSKQKRRLPNQVGHQDIDGVPPLIRVGQITQRQISLETFWT
jgi:hypothetical protein